MKTVILQKSVNLFAYNELSREAKEKVREAFINERVAFSEAFDDLVRQKLIHYGLNPETVYFRYSLSYSQGDGVSFTGSLDVKECNPKVWARFSEGLSRTERVLLMSTLQPIDFVRTNNRYCHENTVSTFFDWDEKIHLSNELITHFFKNVRSWYVDVCKEFERQGYAYFYPSNEEVADYHINELGGEKFWFTADGEQFTEFEQVVNSELIDFEND
jgi:hypothetical protein